MLRPSFHNGFAPRDGQPIYSELWKGCVTALPLLLGVTGQTLRDIGQHKSRLVTPILMGAGTWELSQGLYSQQFSSSVDRYLHYGSAFNYTSQDFTFCLTFMVDSFTTNQPNQGPVLFFKGPFQQRGYYSQVSQSGSANFVVNQSGARQTSALAAGSVQLNRWHTFAVSRSGSSVRMCLDGGVQEASSSSYINPVSSVDDFMLGRYVDSFFSISPNIKIADFRAYDRSLSRSEIQLLTSRPGIAYEMAPRSWSAEMIDAYRRRTQQYQQLVGGGVI